MLTTANADTCISNAVSSGLSGDTRVSADQFISLCALAVAAVADGESKIRHFLLAPSTRPLIEAFEAMGVDIDQSVTEQGRSILCVKGVGLKGLQQPNAPLPMDNSGIGFRLLVGLLVGQTFNTSIMASADLSRQPMSRITAPLSLMGAKIEVADQGCPPLQIQGSKYLVGIEYPQPHVDAVTKAALLLAGLYAKGETGITETSMTANHMENILQAYGAHVLTSGYRACIDGHDSSASDRSSSLQSPVSDSGKVLGSYLQSLKSTDITIPGDLSIAAFLIVGAAITPNSSVILRAIGVNPRRLGFIETLRQMGADIELDNEQFFANEPVADIHVKYQPLKGIDVDVKQLSLANNDFAALCIAAATATGKTRIMDAPLHKTVRQKNVLCMVEGLKSVGVKVDMLADAVEITGGKVKGGVVNVEGQIMPAMAFMVLGLKAKKNIAVSQCPIDEITALDFIGSANSLGFKLQ